MRVSPVLGAFRRALRFQGRRSLQFLVAALVCSSLLLPARTALGASSSASYPEGWNIVGGPTGTTFPVPLYRWDMTAGRYQLIPSGTPVAAGQGYWAYFDRPTTVQLAAGSTAEFPAEPGGAFVLIANPLPDECVGINAGGLPGAGPNDPNVVALDSYDPTQGVYSAGDGVALKPGEGAWVLLQNTAAPRLMRLGAPSMFTGGCILPP